jgi:MFS family permease
MFKTRILYPALAFLAYLAMVLVATLPPWIRELHTVQVVTYLLSSIGAIVCGIWTIRGVWVHTRGKLLWGWRFLISLAVFIVFGFIALFVAFINITNSVDFGLFPQRYDRQAEYSEYDATLYIYESRGFKMKRTNIWLRRGWSPWMVMVGNVGGTPDDLTFSQSGDQLVFSWFSIDLVTGEKIETK